MVFRWLRGLGLAALLIGYPLLAHYTNQSPHNASLGALVAIAPVALIALLFAWRSPRRIAMLGALSLCCVALAAAWPALKNHFDLVYWLENMAMNLVLLMTFGRTLTAGRQALCTRFAEALYGSVSVAHAIYTRQVTLAWTLFFAAMALISSLLFFLAPLTVWSVFSNFLTPPLLALMFIAEYAVRRRVLSELPEMRLLDTVRAFRSGSAHSG